MLDENGKPLPNIITYRAKWDPYSRDHHAVEDLRGAPHDRRVNYLMRSQTFFDAVVIRALHLETYS